MPNKSTVDSQEIAKFAQHSGLWWDKEGPLKTLHDINSARLEFILNYQTLSKKRVLDVGCGGGILTEALAQLDGELTGLDVEAEALKEARNHSIQNRLNINYVNCPIEDYESENFDLVTCMEMLEHVQEPQIVIDHCARLLKRGGYLFLSTINRTPKAYLSAIVAAEYILGLLPRQTHDFDKFIKPSELVTMVRKAGLEFSGLAGLSYNPLNRSAKLHDRVSVNYLLACHKP
ncbi:MAG: bifunctional 2-polyprenyl-6-hydroxyphenol methylase/3-demethylubiquinol 3-O-methyltransferase UbiG [Tatlockia sp.]|nr:bifunctional 2-polyprenyl-6-hydroxyphenol methylase/3-demethylubiquinol 3-O-methyltransferase UbiG [Tatlockia sp.]